MPANGTVAATRKKLLNVTNAPTAALLQIETAGSILVNPCTDKAAPRKTKSDTGELNSEQVKPETKDVEAERDMPRSAEVNPELPHSETKAAEPEWFMLRAINTGPEFKGSKTASDSPRHALPGTGRSMPGLE